MPSSYHSSSCVSFADKDGDEDGPIEKDKPQSEIRQEPLTLPAGFEWDTLDMDSDTDVSL